MRSALLIVAGCTFLAAGSAAAQTPVNQCAACHSATPAITDFGVSPGGVSFDDPARIQALAARIRARAVETRTMPLGNRTNMTDRERALLGKWIDDGALR